MAKFTIEVELDWLEEDSIDEVLQEKVMKGIEDKALKRVIETAEATLWEKLDPTFLDMKKRIEDSVDKFVEDVAENRFAEMKIPQKSSSWSSTVEYIPLSEYVGQRYEAFMNKKILDEHGRSTDRERERKMSLNEFFINKYLEQELGDKVCSLIQKAREEAEKTVIKTLEQNLKNQLSADLISRLNIPALLKDLESKGQMLEQGFAVE